MNFSWNDKTIRWYKNANRYTGFYRNVAEAVAPLLSGVGTMCDLGCGLGLVDLELAGTVPYIDCIDKSLPALRSLDRTIREQGIRNVRPMFRDVDKLHGWWDAALMSFFGSREPDRFLPLFGKIVLVVCAECGDSFIPPEYRRFRKNSSGETERYLVDNHIAYGLSYYEFEFGQPFRNMADAVEFVFHHSPGITQREVDEFLKERLICLDSGEYEYYIPRKKQIGIFELRS